MTVKKSLKLLSKKLPRYCTDCDPVSNPQS